MTGKPGCRLPRAVREGQIVDAAVGVFSRGGYHAAAVDDICERAGISKPMVLRLSGFQGSGVRRLRPTRVRTPGRRPP
ncbi:helix-turn-helix domain-containing protein [Streptomyces sp. ST2-7A]|uniref:helix-turn-helix domain-containing protein n=1 Tax=Streptomyces sp. ST2-7A TaxID=2907214 RepID=UPI0035AB76BB